MSAEPVPDQVVTAWEPLYDKIIVKRNPTPEEARPGVISPEAHRQAQNHGVVVRTGNGRWIDGVLYPLTIKEGMTVLFSRFAGVELEEGEDLLLLREDEILAWRD